MEHKSKLRRIAFLGNYLPRKCGIATFTTDLCESIARAFPDTHCLAVPVNDREEGYNYPERVRFEIREKEIDSYRRAADFLNINNVELLCVQHEFGIFGGPAGSHVLALLKEANMPVVTTLHTVLKNPNEAQRKVMAELAKRSERLVVMTELGAQFLREVFRIPNERLDVIPHGIPDVPFVDPNFYKDQFGVEGKFVLLTFGLLSPNKGIEYVIEALPRILERHPNVVYIVLGATHPTLVRREGESYRLSLERLAEARGVKKNVIFYNRFVSLEELMEFMGVADIYITPYLNEAQITSGTLAYSFGAGKAVISFPYWHAKELLADNRGVLVPFRDSKAIAEHVIDLIENEPKRHAMRKHAYISSREMVWSNTAYRYMEVFEKARALIRPQPRKAFAKRTLDNAPYELPPLKLDHLYRLTDSTGILQHAIHAVPNFSAGYCTDDNARAFILTILLEEIGENITDRLECVAATYLAFLCHAFNPKLGRFRNFMGYDRRWLEEQGSEDSHARALWALATALGRSQNPAFRNPSGEFFEQALSAVLEFTAPRAWAITLIAIHEYLRRFSGDRVANQTRAVLMEKLVQCYKNASAPDWPWYEDVLAYDNARLPHALILSGYWTSQADVLNIGLQTLRWLAEIQTTPAGCFRPIGATGFHGKGKTRADFDQQPIEATSMISACLEAHRVTKDPFWAREAERAFEWFLGRNDLGLPLYDSATGGCRDGLHPDRVNMNQGAESSLSFYLSWAEMRLEQNVMSAAEEKAA